MRLHGSDRFDTAAAISEVYWEFENTLVVALATGENFPDALALGPSNANLGPTLLVRRDSIPESTRRELERLEPCLIVGGGGPGVVSDAVLQQAQEFADPDLCSEPPVDGTEPPSGG